MRKVYWIITFMFTISFFSFFWALKAERPIENGVKLSISLIPNSIKPLDNKDENNIVVKLGIKNQTNKSYDSEKYFYRVILGRAYAFSPGFIVKEFSKDLEPSEVFEHIFTWKEIYLNNEKAKLKVHFNMYKRNGISEPTLVATSTQPLYINSDAKMFPN